MVKIEFDGAFYLIYVDGECEGAFSYREDAVEVATNDYGYEGV